MKTTFKIITLILVSFISLQSYSQTSKELDDRFGILHFKLGTNIKMLENKIQFISNGNSGQKFYDYTLDGSETILGYEISSINLIFYKNLLYIVNLELDQGQEIYKDDILGKLKNMFGNPVSEYNEKKGAIAYKWMHYWITDKVQLSFDKQISEKVSIWIMDNETRYQIERDNF